jgi:LysM repeat protein
VRFNLSKFVAFNPEPVNATLDTYFPGSKRLLLFALVIISFSQISLAQFQPTPVTRSKNRVTTGNTNFYIHEVLKGQTLYGISKAYEVSEEELKKYNADLNQRSVYTGMVLRIPDTGKSVAPALPGKNTKFTSHTVKAKENIYSIARDYSIRPDDIREINPDLKGGLKTGQVIRIPTVNPAADSSVSKAVPEKPSVPATATVDPVSYDEKPCGSKASPHTSEEFRLAILLPLNISQNDTLVFSDTLKAEHFRFYEFLEGAYLAVDSLRQEGMRITLEVYDTERDPQTIRRLIESGSLNDADLIIGPVFPNEIEVVSGFCETKRIPMVSPFSTYDVTRTNPYAFQVRNKLARQIELAAAYLGTKYNQNVLVIGRLAEKKSPDFTRFLGLLGTQLKEHDPAGKATFKTLYYSEALRDFAKVDSVKTSLSSYLSSSLPNYIILTSENEVFITEVVNELYKVASTRNLHVYGISQWAFTELDLGNLYSLGLELTSDFQDDNAFVDYTDSHVLDFCMKYQANWNVEPTKYSFQGFDVTYLFGNALFRYGRNITASVTCWPETISKHPLMTPMRFNTGSSGTGFSNQAITIVRYDKEELTRKKVN